MDRSDVEKVTFFFDIFPVKRDGGAARHGTDPHKLPILRPSPGRNHRPFHARTQLRTHARTHGTATETEIDFPVGHTPQPPMFLVIEEILEN